MNSFFEIVSPRIVFRRAGVGDEFWSIVSFRSWCRLYRANCFDRFAISFASAVTTHLSLVFVLPGANGGAPDLAKLLMDGAKDMRFEVIGYPGWSHYVADGYSAQALVTYLADQIETRMPRGSNSHRWHFDWWPSGVCRSACFTGTGSKCRGFCAIDTFMTSSAAPDPGWLGRATAEGASLARQMASRRVRTLSEIPSLARIAQNWRKSIAYFSSQISPSGLISAIIGLDPLFVEELNMRLLIRHVNPWVPSLDRAPLALNAPASLLRTQSNIKDDAAWRRRCPNIDILEISGGHHTMFEEENVPSLRTAFVAAKRAWCLEKSVAKELSVSKHPTLVA